MKINWTVRIKNKLFWTAIISALLITAQAILHTVGIEWDFGELGNNLIKVVDAVFAVLAILGIVVDPTTKGINDSRRAQTYNYPWKDG